MCDANEDDHCCFFVWLKQNIFEKNILSRIFFEITFFQKLPNLEPSTLNL